MPVLGSPAILRAAGRPSITDGVMCGDLGPNSATIWSRADQAARMLVEWSTTESFAKSERSRGTDAVHARDFTATATLRGLPAGQTIFYRVRFETADGLSEPTFGRLRIPAKSGDKISFVFGGDQVGGGWGINPDWGGLRIYESMLRTEPDILIHLGDRIYADNVLRETVQLEDGTTWRNIVTPAKSHAAQTLDDYRGNYRYNLMDEHVRRFNAAVPQWITWDDHEIIDDWWPGKTIADARVKRLKYASREVDRLIVNGRQAFHEYTPLGEESRRHPGLWRAMPYGPLMEVFMLDSRTDRSPNETAGRTDMDDVSVLLGRVQLDWLKGALARSTALWKVIANPLPIAHIGRANAKGYFDKFSNGRGGAPVGREREIAEILSWIRSSKISNTVWISADVHYAAANDFHPDRAAFHEFNPFWEFIAGPFHTQAFPFARLDPTFGPSNRYASNKGLTGNPPPSAGYCNFGHGEIDSTTGALTVSFRDVAGKTLHKTTLNPDRAR